MRHAHPFRWDLLRRVPRSTVTVLRAAVARLGAFDPAAGRAALAALLGEPVAVRLGPVAAVRREELARLLGTAPQAFVVLERDGRRAAIGCDAVFAAAACRRVLGGDELPAPRALTSAEEGVVAFLALTWLGGGAAGAGGAAGGGGAGRAGGAAGAGPGGGELPPGGPRLHGVTQDAAEVVAHFPDPWVVIVEVDVRAAGHDSTARVLLPESLPTAAPPVSPAGLRRLEPIPVRCPVEVGRGLVPAAHVAALAPGDVVLLDDLRLHPDRGGPARLRAGRLVVPLSVAPGGTATVTGAPHVQLASQGDEMSDMSHGAAPAERLAALEVEVAAEIGRVVLSGRELAALGPGAVVELRRPLGGPVDLVVAGRLVARGELVDVDGEIGVRVTEVVG